MNNSILQYAQLVISSEQWRLFQSLATTKIILTNFFVLILVVNGTAPETIILALSCLMLANYLLMEKIESSFLADKKMITTSLCILSSTLIALFCIIPKEFSVPSMGLLVLGISILATITDLNGIESNWSLQAKATENNFSNVLIQTIAGNISEISIAAALLIAGILAGFNEYLVFWVAAFIILLSVKLANHHKDRPQLGKTLIPKVKINEDVKKQFTLGIIYTAIATIGRTFILPMYFYSITTQLGFEKDAFRYLGIALSLVIIVTCCSRPIINRFKFDPYNSMITNYAIGITVWICISIMYYLNVTTTTIILSAILYTIFEITVKIWNGGYIARLEEVARENQCERYSLKILFKQYLLIYSKLSKVFSATIFFILFLAYPYLNPKLTLLTVGILGLLFGLFVHTTTKRTDIRNLSMNCNH